MNPNSKKSFDLNNACNRGEQTLFSAHDMPSVPSTVEFAQILIMPLYWLWAQAGTLQTSRFSHVETYMQYLGY